MRSLRLSLNETPRMSGSPAMSLPMSDAITTAMPSLMLKKIFFFFFFLCRIPLRYRSRPHEAPSPCHLLATLVTSCLAAARARAVRRSRPSPDGGQGTYGEADDKVVTNFGFVVIAFFPTLILLLSLLQWRLDKRREARKAARKRRG